MTFVVETTRISYAVEIPLERFSILSAYDYEHYGSMFDEKMKERFRGPEVELNEHFGNAVYFTLDVEEATPENLKWTTDTLEEAIVVAEKWKSSQ